MNEFDCEYLEEVSAPVAERLVRIADETVALQTDDHMMVGAPIGDDEWVLFLGSQYVNQEEYAVRLTRDQLSETLLNEHEKARPADLRNYIWREGPSLGYYHDEKAADPVIELGSELQNHKRHEPVFDW